MHQRKQWILLAVIVFSLLAGVTDTAHAQNSAIYWKRWDVDITRLDTINNVFHVKETHMLVANSRAFNGGDRKIPLNRVTGITNVQMSENGQPYTVLAQSPTSCEGRLGHVCVSVDDGQQIIYYNFFARAQVGQERTVVIEYDVTGALRSYPDGDQLFWGAIAADRPAEIVAGRITVQMPDGVNPNRVATYPDTWVQSGDGRTLIFTAPGTIAKGELIEVRVQYPHNPRMTAPAWQAGYDLEVRLMPIITLLMAILGGFIGIGGMVWTVVKWSGFRRGIEPPVVPEYLTEPPGQFPAGIAGTLIDGSADTRDVMGTLMDLARRGYLVIEQTEERSLLGTKTEFTFHKLDGDGASLRKYESTMLNGLFGGMRDSVELAALRNKFYTTVETMKRELNAEMVTEKIYRRAPSDIFGRWLGGGIALIVVGAVGGSALLAGEGIPDLLRPLLFPLGALAFLGMVFTLLSRGMVTRTADGQLQYVKWRAFRKYLDNIEKYTDLAQAKDKFEQYLGYAVAFGLDKEWFRKFAPVLTSMPEWYHHSSGNGRWRRDWSGDRGPSWEGGVGSRGGLNEMSGNLTQGLAAMSGGLTALLNTASAVMTSQPSSSSSGGFSGGGGGGGSSGGGSAGFH
jgi:hypothetical protein